MSDPQSDIDVIRRRPGMFIGDIYDGSGLAHMVWELLANALDEHVGGFCQAISIVINPDGSVTVRDDGRGISIHDLGGVPFAQQALTSLHRTPTFDGHAPHEHVGLHGVGLVAVNALSSWLELEIRRAGRCYRQRYERGVPTGMLEAVEPTEQTGTTITFHPDPAIFPDPWLNAGTIARRLRELACLMPSLRFTFADERRQEFHESRGLRVFLERTRYPAESILATLTIDERVGEISIEAAIEWRDHQWSSIRSYANIHPTTDGGTHVRGLLNGLALGLQDVEKGRTGPLRLERVRYVVNRGLHAILCVRLRDPTYDSPTKSKLMNPAVTTAVSRVLRGAIVSELRDNSSLRQRWLRLLGGD